jgi:hypothetical protein
LQRAQNFPTKHCDHEAAIFCSAVPCITRASKTHSREQNNNKFGLATKRSVIFSDAESARIPQRSNKCNSLKYNLRRLMIEEPLLVYLEHSSEVWPQCFCLPPQRKGLLGRLIELMKRGVCGGIGRNFVPLKPKHFAARREKGSLSFLSLREYAEILNQGERENLMMSVLF